MSEKPRFEIPEQFHAGIKSLLAMSDRDMKRLLTALKDLPPIVGRKDFINHVVAAVAIDNIAVRDILGFVLGLYSLRSNLDALGADFIAELCNAIQATQIKDLQPVGGDWEPFKGRLDNLLSLDRSIGVVAKARALWFEQQATLINAQVVTDVRPVFADNAEDKPVASLIVHQLRLTYLEGYERKEFFVALDANDVRKMRATLSRAESKGKSLASLLESAMVTVSENQS